MSIPLAPYLTIRLYFMYDGRLALQLANRGTTLDLRVVSADDTEAIAAVARDWIVNQPTEELSWSEFTRRFPDHAEACTVTIGPNPSTEMSRMSDESYVLASRFASAFGSPQGADSEAEIRDFCQQLAQNAARFWRRGQSKAIARMANGEYLPILEAYVEWLSSIRAAEDQGYYTKLDGGVGGILRDEQYLKLSPEPSVRELYAAFEFQEQQLYNWQQELAHWGTRRPRE